MPELPEVETIRRQLTGRLVGTRVTAADADPSPKFAPATRIVGAGIQRVRRRGKYLLLGTDDHRELVIHLGMTGVLSFETAPPEVIGSPGCPPWRRAWWALDDATTLTLDDQRRFGRVAVVPEGRYSSLATLAALGPEPLSEAFTPAGFAAALARQHRHIKTALLAQRVVAGVGNIYADEALWRAGINPAVHRLGPARAARLHGAIVAVLTEAIDHGGTRLRDYRSVEGDTGGHQEHLDTYGRAGQECHRCSTMLRRRIIDARGTTWCPMCQAR